jgi:hypothetical protein
VQAAGRQVLVGDQITGRMIVDDKETARMMIIGICL